MYNSNSVAERIKIQTKSSGTTIKQMLEGVELGFNTMSNMKASMPKADNLAKIADYLDCSIDYLMGRTENPQSHKIQDNSFVNNATIRGDYNTNAGNINVNTPLSTSASYKDELKDELDALYDKLTVIQQAKLLSLVSDVVDGKAKL